MSKVDIVIINWNSGGYLKNCLSSLEECQGSVISKVVVVDNASSDDSLPGEDEYNLPLELIRNQENLGFAKACNLGAATCRSDYLLFLNPDMELVPNILDTVMRFMDAESNRKVGICGIQLENETGKIAPSCSYFPTPGRLMAQYCGINRIPGLSGTGVRMLDWDHSESRQVDQVIGAFFFTRRDLFQTLNGFDERFFVYYEEVDFSKRAKELGWDTWYLAETRAVHAGGGTSNQVKASRLFYSLRSRILYCFKHFNKLEAWGVLGFTLLLEPLLRIIFSVLSGKLSQTRETVIGYSILWREIFSILPAKQQFRT